MPLGPALTDNQKAALNGLIERELVPLRRMQARYGTLQGAITPEGDIAGAFTDFEPILLRTRSEIDLLVSLQQDLELVEDLAPALAAVG